MNKKKIIIAVLGVIIIVIMGYYFIDEVVKKQNYKNECSQIPTRNWDACSANYKCGISYCPEFSGSQTACCPKGLIEMFSNR